MKRVYVIIFLLIINNEYSIIFAQNNIDTIKYNSIPFNIFNSLIGCESEIVYRERIIPTEDGCLLYIRELGEGVPIVFLHGGWGADLELLYYAFRYFKNDYRLIFYDQRGSIRSKCCELGTITVENHTNDLNVIREALKLEKFKIIAHSMGTFLSMKYIEKFGIQYIDQLILIGALPLKDVGDIQETGFYRLERQEIISELKKHNLDTTDKKNFTVKEMFKWSAILGAAVNLYDISRFPYLTGMVNFNSKAGQEAAESMENNWDFRQSLSQSNININFIHGDDDFIPAIYHYEIIKELPTIKLTIIESAGHASWVDQPEIITDLIKRILEQK